MLQVLPVFEADLIFLFYLQRRSVMNPFRTITRMMKMSSRLRDA